MPRPTVSSMPSGSCDRRGDGPRIPARDRICGSCGRMNSTTSRPSSTRWTAMSFGLMPSRSRIARSMVIWPRSPTEVPNAYFMPLVWMMAHGMASSFGRPVSTESSVLARADDRLGRSHAAPTSKSGVCGAIAGRGPSVVAAPDVRSTLDGAESRGRAALSGGPVAVLALGLLLPAAFVGRWRRAATTGYRRPGGGTDDRMPRGPPNGLHEPGRHMRHSAAGLSGEATASCTWCTSWASTWRG